MKEYKKITEQLNKGKWEQTYTETDKELVLQSLTTELISKKINKCTWITRIERKQLYNGYQKIKVNYCNNTRCIYVIPD